MCSFSLGTADFRKETSTNVSHSVIPLSTKMFGTGDPTELHSYIVDNERQWLHDN